MDQYGVAVVGGGPAGVCAAIAAARSGASTLLVTDRPVLGGNSSSEIRVWTRGATGGGNLFAEEMGIWGELKLDNLYRNPLCNVLAWDDVLLDAVLREPNLTLRLNTLVTGVSRSGDKIEALTIRGLRTEKTETVNAQMVVDCSGDGFVGKEAGLPYRTGREDQTAFGEDFAQSKADNHSQGCSILIQTKRIGKPAPYMAPDYAYSLEKVEQLVNRGGRVISADMQGSDCWWFEYGGQLDVIADDQKIGLELRAIALGIWNYIKNSGKYDAEDLQLEWMGYYPGRRSSRRLVGEYTLVQDDVVHDRQRGNAVAYGGWYMDSHPSGGVLSEKEQCKQLTVHSYGIPFGCLYNNQVSNLLFAGRCISMSYVAFTSARIMNTCALLGHAAGTAAAMCAHYNESPKELQNKRFAQLQRRLILEDNLLANPLPMGQASITASSQKHADAQDTAQRLPLVQEAFVTFPSEAGQQTKVWVECTEDTRVTYYVDNTPLPSRRTDRATNAQEQTVECPSGKHCLVLQGEAEGFTVIRLAPNENCALVGGTDLPGVLAGYCDEAELFDPCITLSTDKHYAPANVQDGYLRPWNGTRAWVSEGVKEGGETLTLRWAEPRALEDAALYFDPDLSMELSSSRALQWDRHHRYTAREGMPLTLVKNYELIAHTAAGDVTVASVTNNTQRRRTHTFAPVQCDALTLRITATYGGDAVVYAVVPNIEYDRL